MESHSRQRLRPWLEARIESQELPGLTWIDKKKQIFRVPWKHGGKHDWNEQHSLIFKEWAVHTGRYREGVDTPDWPTWKTRFRCALNKLPDIREEKELSCLEGLDPFRAYRFMPKSSMTTQRSDAKILIPTPQRSKERQGPHITGDQQDGILNLIDGATNDNLPSDLNEMNFDLLHRDDICMETSDVSNDSSFGTMQIGVDANENSQYLVKQEELSPQTPHHPPGLSPLNMEAPANEIHITVQYRDNLVLQCDVNNTQGCRLIYKPEGPMIQSPVIPSFKKAVYGPEGADDIIFPMIENPDCDQQSRLTAHLLRALERGVYLECRDGDIYATRKCKCVVFVQSQSQNGEPYKLVRDEETKIFDFQIFIGELYLYMSGQGTKPLPCVLLGLGQNWKNSSNPQNTLLISANVYSSKARHMITKVSCSSPLSPPVEVSRSDDIDRFMRHLRDVDVSSYQPQICNPMVCYQ